jgi:hypothetical protein
LGDVELPASDIAHHQVFVLSECDTLNELRRWLASGAFIGLKPAKKPHP